MSSGVAVNAALLALESTCALAEENRPPRLVPLRCNFRGGLTGLDLFRVEIPDVDLERGDATIPPARVDMVMAYGQGPVVGPISVAGISIAPGTVDGVPNG